jgi:uncharacterized protein (TIGR00369 family)
MGMKLARLAAGEADIAMTIAPHHHQYQGLAHGGVLAALADTAATFAACTVLPEGIDLVTIEFKVNFIAGLPGGRALARGRVVRSGGRVSVADVSVFGPTRRRLILTGTFTMLNFPIKKSAVDGPQNA